MSWLTWLAVNMSIDMERCSIASTHFDYIKRLSGLARFHCFIHEAHYYLFMYFAIGHSTPYSHAINIQSTARLTDWTSRKVIESL